MGDKYKSPSMDWTSPGDLRRRFQLFRQKCELIFDGPLTERDEAYKVRMLLLWVDDRGLEIYNTAQWAAPAHALLLRHVWRVLEAYVQPQSNEVLSRYQLRCLKQDDLSVEQFVTKARLLVDECNFPAAVRDKTLRDTLVFGIKSEKVRRDAIDIGNDLTFQQPCEDLRKHGSSDGNNTAI